VAGDLHRDRLRHASAFEIPHCGAPKVMHDQARTTCVATRALPGFAEALKLLTVTMEQPRDDLTSLTGALALSLQNLAQLGG
jgi:hypothetical protein